MNRTREIVITGLAIALVYLATAFISIRLPIAAQGGLIHLGNVPLFIFALLCGRKVGALSGAIGMGLFDILSGWLPWAPFTFIIVGSMGYIVGLVGEKHQSTGWYSIAIAIACLIKIVGYYLAEVFIYGNWLTPFASIPGNLCQIGVATVIALPLTIILQKQLNFICPKNLF